MRRLLIVEDDRLVYEAMQTAFLMTGGFDLDYAEDGEVALTALAIGKFDLALIDYGLPKVSGLTVAKQALAQSIPVILMTGYSENIAKLEEHEFPVLAKPFRVTELAEGFEQVFAEAARLNRIARRELERSAALMTRRRALMSDEWLRIRERLRTRNSELR